jgi:integrase
MSADNSTTPALRKPAKPYPDFPLYAHASGRWAKKIRQRLHYFGKWEGGWQAALDAYDAQKDALHSGKKAREDPAGLMVKDLCSAFLNAKQSSVRTGELSQRSLSDYRGATDMLVKFFGGRRFVVDLGPDDFAELRAYMARRWGPVRLGNTIQRVRCVFKYGFDAELIERVVRFGAGFARPSKKVLRLARAKQGVKLFSAEEIRKILGIAGPSMKAMILLGINCGFGNADCANLPTLAVDLDKGWIDFPRPKTGIERRCPLWPETVTAIREALAVRPEPKDLADAGLLFITKYGWKWSNDTSSNPISQETRKLLQELHIGGRKGIGFYTLRHSFRTVADASKDQPAIDHIMGHESPHMSSVYRETIDDARLQAVVDHVRKWLFGK